jgi:hypothetical protein
VYSLHLKASHSKLVEDTFWPMLKKDYERCHFYSEILSMAHKLNNSRRTIAVDFDGVIAEYDGYKGRGLLGEPRLDVLEALRELRSEGWKIVIHTTRGEHEISGYLTQHGIPFDEINRNSDYETVGPKPVADLYWDDRAVSYSGDARKDLGFIRTFKTWSGRE